MAPFVGPSREGLLQLLRASEPRLPITLGQCEPQALVQQAGARWRLVRLVMDEAKLTRIAEERSREGCFMPEHTWGALVPGPVVIDVGSREELIRRVEEIDWEW